MIGLCVVALYISVSNGDSAGEMHLGTQYTEGGGVMHVFESVKVRYFEYYEAHQREQTGYLMYRRGRYRNMRDSR